MRPDDSIWNQKLDRLFIFETKLEKMQAKNRSKLFWLFLLIAAGILTLNGILTEVHLGDESHHYRFAQNIYQTGKRVPFDPLYESGNPPGFFYNTPPLWHFGLAFLWKITGGISQTIAQIYHTLFFILLIWVTSLIAKETRGEEGRWVPAFIIATVPMVVSFSTLLYMDIPSTALSTLSFYLILKRRYMEAGVASGLAYFTKLNSGFFFPGFLLLIFWKERRNFWHLLRSFVLFSLPILMIYFPDLYWRKINITSQNTVGWSNISHRAVVVLTGTKWGEYLISYLTNPIDLVKYFGLAYLFLMSLHLCYFRRWDRKDAILWVPVFSYLFFFVIFFGVETEIRYLLPILPFMIVLSTPSILSLGKQLRFIVIAVCILQLASTTYYVYQKRLISPEVKEGFGYIRKNVPKNALILYPEENLLIYAQRRIIWIAVQSKPGKVGLSSLFWSTDDKEMDDLFEANRIDYVMVKKSRIYDDRNDRHLGGYPQSFLERLSHSGGWVKIYENPGVALWKKVLREG